MIISISGKKNSGKDTVATMLQYLLDREYFGLTNPITFKGYTSYMNNNHSLNSDWKIKKFADPLKDMTCILIGCTREQLEDREFKEKELGEEWWKFELTYNSSIEYRDYLSHQEFLQKDMKKYLGDDVKIGVIKMTPRKLMQLLGTECGKEILHPALWEIVLMRNYTISETWIITDTRFPREVKSVKSLGGVNIRINRSKYNTSPEKFKEHISETALDDYKDWTYVLENKGDLEDLLKEVIKLKEHLQKHGHII